MASTDTQETKKGYRGAGKGKGNGNRSIIVSKPKKKKREFGGALKPTGRLNVLLL